LFHKLHHDFHFLPKRSFIYKIMCIFAAKSQSYGTIFSIFYRFLLYQRPSVAPHLHASPLHSRGVSCLMEDVITSWRTT
jgi:hypothetical protein